MRVGADRGDMDQRSSAGSRAASATCTRALDMHRLHVLAEQRRQIDDRGRAVDRAANARGLGHVGRTKPNWPTCAERLDGIGAARIALGDPDPDAALEQDFADVAADETAAAEHRHKLFVALDHGAAP